MGLYFQNVKSPKHSTLGNCTLEVAMPDKRGCFCYLSEFFSCMCSVNHNIQYLILLSIHGAFKWNTTEGISYLHDLQNTLINPPPLQQVPTIDRVDLFLCPLTWPALAKPVCTDGCMSAEEITPCTLLLFYTLEVRPSRSPRRPRIFEAHGQHWRRFTPRLAAGEGIYQWYLIEVFVGWEAVGNLFSIHSFTA